MARCGATISAMSAPASHAVVFRRVVVVAMAIWPEMGFEGFDGAAVGLPEWPGTAHKGDCCVTYVRREPWHQQHQTEGNIQRKQIVVDAARQQVPRRSDHRASHYPCCGKEQVH
jgi:hypothetical protein